MNKKFLIIILLSFFLININNQHANAGIGFAFTASDTDTATLSTFQGESLGLFYVFDLRDRETFIQFTYPDPRNSGFSAIAHIQIFDVSNNCNENDFFDNYTVNDTHTYNMRDIQTNDGNPSDDEDWPNKGTAVLMIFIVLLLTGKRYTARRRDSILRFS